MGCCMPQLLLLLTISTFCTSPRWWSQAAASTTVQELVRGFKATPDPAISSFQAFLADSTGNYSLGFLRVNKTQLALAVVHVPSDVSIWQANMTRLARWANPTQLVFNGSLVLSDAHSGVFWSTYTDGDRVWLSNTSNLQIQTSGDLQSVVWQSFDFPTNTLVENQNFTSNMSLVTPNGLYSLRLGSDFMALYQDVGSESYLGQMYWKHKALEAKADVVLGAGPIYAVVNPHGFLGMYQNVSIPVDIQTFNSYQQNVSGVRRLYIEDDGNLKGYFWTGSNWILDFQAISDPCELPSACGSYGLCTPGSTNKVCSCLDNQTVYASGRSCVAPNRDSAGDDFCSAYDNKYKVLRANRVELPYKELMGYEKKASLEQCESACENNCTCWGAVYSNSSGFCYMLDYPIQTLLGVGDESKVGFFKVRESVGKGKMKVAVGVGVGVLCGALVVLGGVVGLRWYRFRKRKRGVSGFYGEEDGVVGVGPYKDLGAASFKSIEVELSER